MSNLLYLVAAYLVGAIPTGYLVGKAYGIDLRREGSGNYGGSNVFRVMGGRAAALVLPLDVLKGFIPVWFFPQWDGSAAAGWGIAYGSLAIAGHIWSVFVGFRGGKGVATGAGALLAIAPLAVFIGSLVWVGVVLITQLASVASLIAATVVPLVAYMSDAPPMTVGFAFAVATFVWWTHRSNLRRLAQRQELRLDFRSSGSKRESNLP